jgi:hypothetical protein
MCFPAFGSLLLFLWSVLLFKAIHLACQLRKGDWHKTRMGICQTVSEHTFLGALEGLIKLAIFVNLIVGAVYVFGVYKPNLPYDESDDDSCHETAYWYITLKIIAFKKNLLHKVMKNVISNVFLLLYFVQVFLCHFDHLLRLPGAGFALRLVRLLRPLLLLDVLLGQSLLL